MRRNPRPGRCSNTHVHPPSDLCAPLIPPGGRHRPGRRPAAQPRRRRADGVAGRRCRHLRRRRPARRRHRHRRRAGPRCPPAGRPGQLRHPAPAAGRSRGTAGRRRSAAARHRLDPDRSRSHDGSAVRPDAARRAVPAHGHHAGRGLRLLGLHELGLGPGRGRAAPPVRPPDPGRGLGRARAGAARRPPVLPGPRDDGAGHRCRDGPFAEHRQRGRDQDHGRASPVAGRQSLG